VEEEEKQYIGPAQDKGVRVRREESKDLAKKQIRKSGRRS